MQTDVCALRTNTNITNRVIAFECHRRHCHDHLRSPDDNQFIFHCICGFCWSLLPKFEPVLSFSLWLSLLARNCDTCQINYIEANLYCYCRRWICHRMIAQRFSRRHVRPDPFGWCVSSPQNRMANARMQTGKHDALIHRKLKTHIDTEMSICLHLVC